LTKRLVYSSDMIDLARTTLDPGCFSSRGEEMTSFYENEVGLPFLERLEHSPQYRELMLSLYEGKLKIQSFDEEMPNSASGYRSLIFARDGATEVRDLNDPDGSRVTVVPVGHRGVTNIGLTCAVADVEVQRRFYVDGMGAVESEGGLSVGTTRIFVTHDASQTKEANTPPRSVGFVYVTLIVHEAETACRTLLEAGADESLRMLRLDDRCVFCWLRDPHGNWIEIVQYADLSGPLPEIDRISDHWPEVQRWRETGIAHA